MAIYIPEEKISEIKNAADIVDIISEVVILKKTGKNYVGLCPFHAEKAPSFTVSPEKQIFHCFGCATGGNVFSFLMKREGLSFPEVARMLAKRYGIDLPTPKMSPEQQRRMSERERLFGINRLAIEHFRRGLLETAAGKNAMAYLKQRGMTRATIDRFNLGYALGGWEHLKKFLTQKKIAPALAEKSGLIVPRKNKDGYYDRFRNRIIFPIYDTGSQIIGFGGRVMDDSLPKYMNSPETPLYNKRRSLYGLHLAKRHCREHDTVYIVEGYFDLLVLHQHGIKNVVATLGTALTPQHVRLLKGYAARAILVYDSDDAGIKAALRSIETFMQEEVDARIIVLPEGYDPDSFILEFGHERFMEAVSQAKGIMSFLTESAIKKHGLSIEGKIRIVQDLKAPFAAVSDNVAKSLYIKELAERIGVDEAAVWEKIRTTTTRQTAGETGFAGKASLPERDRLEQQIIKMMLQFPEILSEIDKRNILDLFNDDVLKSIGQLVRACSHDSQSRVSDIISSINDDEQRDLVSQMSIDEEDWNQKNCLKILARFELNRSRRQKALIDEKIKAAQENNDDELLQKLMAEKHKMAVQTDKRKMALSK